MYFASTRDPQQKKSLSEALTLGLAEDGGLFIPEYFPKPDLESLSTEQPFPLFAEKILAEYFQDDLLAKDLGSICSKAFNFPLPLKTINDNTFILELFHGPTLSFKDFGARFLAEALACVPHPEITIMVATSGDTGSAVAAAFYLKPKIKVVILYPKDKITARQEHQIACWGDNVKALAVEGSFDDCQKLVKAAFQDPEWQQSFHLSSANSINIGRLLPQLTYYAYVSLAFYRQQGKAPGFIIPSGNLGHATAAYWAKQMGFPLREIVLSTNANLALPDYLSTGHYEPRPSIATLANAMDVGNPSNFERLKHLFPDFSLFRQEVKALSADDEQIRQTILAVYQRYREILCPHTATAFFAREQLSAQPWIVVATADASKFETIIEPLLGLPLALPLELKKLLERPLELMTVPPKLAAIKKIMLST